MAGEKKKELNQDKDVLYNAILEAEREGYIKGMAEGLEKITPHGLSNEEKNKYAITRNAIFTCYFLIESILNEVITYFILFALGSEVIDDNIDMKSEKLLDCWVDIAYKKKLRLINEIFKKSDIDFKVLYKLDDLRDMFAHNFPLKNERYDYKGRNIVKFKKSRHNFFEELSPQFSKLTNLRNSEFNRLIKLMALSKPLKKGGNILGNV